MVAHTHVIEFQKRGLPHAHILLILSAEHKLRTTDDYDNIVCAEIPDPVLQPKLYNIVTTAMVHGPCGQPGIKKACEKSAQSINNTCRFNFPKKLQQNTTEDKDSYPSYRRREGTTFTRGVGESAETIDNKWISSYSPILSSKYNCHINVEICASISAVKYLHKYIFKGHDMTMITLEKENDAGGNPPPVNEIKEYSAARYVTANEAIWHLFGFEMSSLSPSIIRYCLYVILNLLHNNIFIAL